MKLSHFNENYVKAFVHSTIKSYQFYVEASGESSYSPPNSKKKKANQLIFPKQNLPPHANHPLILHYSHHAKVRNPKTDLQHL
jgi:hypothetical protein